MKSQEDIDGTLESSHNYLIAFDSGISGRHTIINDGKSNDNEYQRDSKRILPRKNSTYKNLDKKLSSLFNTKKKSCKD